jgi:hypothetical protein
MEGGNQRPVTIVSYVVLALTSNETFIEFKRYIK